jgi:hypothetical protein
VIIKCRKEEDAEETGHIYNQGSKFKGPHFSIAEKIVGASGFVWGRRF